MTVSAPVPDTAPVGRIDLAAIGGPTIGLGVACLSTAALLAAARTTDWVPAGWPGEAESVPGRAALVTAAVVATRCFVARC